MSSVQFLNRLGHRGWGGGWGRGGRFSRDPLPVFSAGGPCQQFCHGQGCHLFVVVHPAFPLPTTATHTLKGALKDSLGRLSRLQLHLSQPLESLGHHRWLHKQFLPFFLSYTALWNLANSRPVNSLMFPSNLFFCLPCLLSPVTVPCKMVLARPNERETCPYHCSLRLFTTVRRSSCLLNLAKNVVMGLKR